MKSQREMMQLMMTQMEKRFESQHSEIMAIHQVIKQQIRWFFAATVGVGGSDSSSLARDIMVYLLYNYSFSELDFER